MHTQSLNNSASIEIEDQTSAIRWFIKNRRQDLSVDTAIKQLRLALRGDVHAQSTLDSLESHDAVSNG